MLKKIKRTKKFIFLLVISTFIMSLSIGCTKNITAKNIITLGISVDLSNNFKVGFSESKMFNYNNTSIPSITIQALNKNESLLFKSFPFTIEDYKTHFKSAFDGENLKEIKYDYKEIKIKKNENINKIYESKAILQINAIKKYSYVYIIEFNDRSGCLIIETTSKNDKNYKHMLESIKLITTNVAEIELKENNFNEKLTIKNVNIIEDIYIKMPEYFQVKSSYNKNAYYTNGFGENELFYTIVSKQKPMETNNINWNNINGYEVIKKYSKNIYLIHDLNIQEYFYLETNISKVSSKSGTQYYIRLEKLWR